jgi:hypothetical protein
MFSAYVGRDLLELRPVCDSDVTDCVELPVDLFRRGLRSVTRPLPAPRSRRGRPSMRQRVAWSALFGAIDDLASCSGSAAMRLPCRKRQRWKSRASIQLLRQRRLNEPLQIRRKLARNSFSTAKRSCCHFVSRNYLWDRANQPVDPAGAACLRDIGLDCQLLVHPN